MGSCRFSWMYFVVSVGFGTGACAPAQDGKSSAATGRTAIFIGKHQGTQETCRRLERVPGRKRYSQFEGDVKPARYSRSRIPAAPIPPPIHIVTMPYRALRRCNSRRIVAVNFAPVQPSGCPRAIAPPFGLTREGS